MRATVQFVGMPVAWIDFVKATFAEAQGSYPLTADEAAERLLQGYLTLWLVFVEDDGSQGPELRGWLLTELAHRGQVVNLAYVYAPNLGGRLLMFSLEAVAAYARSVGARSIEFTTWRGEAMERWEPVRAAGFEPVFTTWRKELAS